MAKALGDHRVARGPRARFRLGVRVLRHRSSWAGRGGDVRRPGAGAAEKSETPTPLAFALLELVVCRGMDLFDREQFNRVLAKA